MFSKKLKKHHDKDERRDERGERDKGDGRDEHDKGGSDEHAHGQHHHHGHKDHKHGPGHCYKRASGVFGFKVGQPALRLPVKEARKMPLEVKVTNEQKIPISFTPTTLGGRPARLDGELSVTVISGTGTTAPKDGASFFLISGDDVGDTTFLVEGDADLGEGKETIQDTVIMHVGDAHASNLGLVAGTAEPK